MTCGKGEDRASVQRVDGWWARVSPSVRTSAGKDYLCSACCMRATGRMRAAPPGRRLETNHARSVAYDGLSVRPVLKHGPRSLAHAQVKGS